MSEQFEVTMTRTQMGKRDDGFESEEFVKGETYTINASLRRAFVDDLECAVDTTKVAKKPKPRKPRATGNKAAKPDENK